MKKIKNGKIIMILLICLIIAGSSPAALADSGNTASASGTAAQLTEKGLVTAKEETVYGTLHADGKVASIYVVNILDVAEAGIIQDYGQYAEVKNLTNLESIVNQNGVTTVTAAAGKFYYQGNIATASLPWDFSIRYTLDGQAISAEALAGKSGQLVIDLQTAQNAAADSAFYNNYLLQISIKLDAGQCANIVADGATLANSGKNKLITFTVMPETDGHFQVSAEVAGFAMDGITIAALPFSMDFDLPDTSGMTDRLTQLTDAIAQLDKGIAELNQGIHSLSSGAISLVNGSAEYKSGIAAVSAKSNEIIAASKAINDALSTLSSSLASGMDLSSLTAVSALPAALGSFSAGIADISSGLAEFKSGYAMAYTSLDSAITAIPDPISESDLQVLYAANAGNATFAQLMAQYTAAQTVKGTYAAVKPAFAAVGTTLETVIQSLDTLSAAMNSLSSQLAASLAGQDIAGALAQLASGLTALADNYSTFHAGLTAYTNGIKELSTNYSTFHAGLAGFSGGLADISAGTATLAGGSSEMAAQTRDLPAELQQSIADLISNYDHSDYVPVSFVSAQNQSVTGVQFVLMTEDIKMTVEPAVVPEPKAKTIWDRLLALFA